MKAKVIEASMTDETLLIEVDGGKLYLDCSGCWRCRHDRKCVVDCWNEVIGEEVNCSVVCCYDFVESVIEA